jgi:hypothetical protein
MPKYLKGQAALASLGMLGAIAAAGTAVAANDSSQAIVSPAARATQLPHSETRPAREPMIQVSQAALTEVVEDTKYGRLRVPAEVAAAYKALPRDIQEKLGDPKGGEAVNLTELKELARPSPRPSSTIMCPW